MIVVPSSRDAVLTYQPARHMRWAWVALNGCRSTDPILAIKIRCAFVRGRSTTGVLHVQSRVTYNGFHHCLFCERFRRAILSNLSPPECNVTMPCDFSGVQQSRARVAFRERYQSNSEQRVARLRNAMADANVGSEQVVGGRPAGCPRSFCGCGASIRVFGRIVPGLNLASNWLRFPACSASAGHGGRPTWSRFCP